MNGKTTISCIGYGVLRRRLRCRSRGLACPGSGEKYKWGLGFGGWSVLGWLAHYFLSIKAINIAAGVSYRRKHGLRVSMIIKWGKQDGLRQKTREISSSTFQLLSAYSNLQRPQYCSKPNPFQSTSTPNPFSSFPVLSPPFPLLISTLRLKLLYYNSFRRMQKPQLFKQTINQANKSPLNTSKSKAMFTFPKGQRFVHLSESGSLFYDKPSMLSKRAPSFGYGDKIDIAVKKSVPSPDKYTFASDFQKSPKSGITIGPGRDDCKSVSIFNQSHNPGPGEYNLQRDKENIKNMTMGSKLKFPSIWADSIAPGPGKYQIEKIDSNGLCMTSKYKSKNCFKIHPKSPEKEDKSIEALGPGTYNTNLSSTGKQVLARNKTEKSFIFSKKTRQTIADTTLSPGPGAYKHYSIFGLL